ncbi:MAG: hypothetical protein KGQ79_09970 [Proteobacteria bacterium]|nr:hypothetical protein [Pseudomonadota bacterium]MBU6426167.1 hypothetical protein [Rhodospirillales bacterium]
MTFPACPGVFTAAFYPSGCSKPVSGATATPPLLAAHPLTWHMVPLSLSPSSSALVLVLLSVLFTTLLISKPQK